MATTASFLIPSNSLFISHPAVRRHAVLVTPLTYVQFHSLLISPPDATPVPVGGPQSRHAVQDGRLQPLTEHDALVVHPVG
jgi:hypothetical protein